MSRRESFGIHDQAFHVGRAELLQWINGLLDLHYTKVEQCANGAAYCMILNATFQEALINPKKILIDAKLEHDIVKNYKLLQAAFMKKGINKHIDVERLIKAKPLDNLEMIQWFKRYYDLHGGAPGGHPSSIAGDGAELHHQQPKAERGPPKQKPPQQGASPGAARRAPVPGGKFPASSANGGPKQPPAGGESRGWAARGLGVAEGSPSSSDRARTADGLSRGGMPDASKEAERLREGFSELELTVDMLERERDFYYNKLRVIELLCMEMQEQGEGLTLVESITGILYAKEDIKEADEKDVKNFGDIGGINADYGEDGY